MITDTNKEEKELLLKDLSARLPYDPFVKIGNNPHPFRISQRIKWIFSYGKVEDIFDNVKPYLRPMSSMTEDEKKKAKENGCIIYWDTSSEDKGLMIIASPEGFDWLNKKIFDYRKDNEGETMIEKGLALEAPEDMYK